MLLDARDGRFVEGGVSPGLLWEIAYLALTPEEAALVLLGAPPAEEGLAPVAAFSVGDAIRVDLADPDGRVRQQTGLEEWGLWSKDCADWNEDGYLIEYSYDRAATSFHILTTDGIRGRDILAD